VEITPIAISTIGWQTYLIFMSTNACIIPIVWLFFPETTSMPLECADHLFETGGFTRNAHKGAKHTREVMEKYALAHGGETHTESPPTEVWTDSNSLEKKA
jgi:hypothetical protein